MSLFDWLLVAHLAGDFLLQSGEMARRKVTEWSWMARHVALYMLPLALVVVIYAAGNALPFWRVVVALLFLAATHAFLDRRALTQRWMQLLNVAADVPEGGRAGVEAPKDLGRDDSWLAVVVDQVFHLLTLVVAVQILLQAG